MVALLAHTTLSLQALQYHYGHDHRDQHYHRDQRDQYNQQNNDPHLIFLFFKFCFSGGDGLMKKTILVTL